MLRTEHYGAQENRRIYSKSFSTPTAPTAVNSLFSTVLFPRVVSCKSGIFSIPSEDWR